MRRDVHSLCSSSVFCPRDCLSSDDGNEDLTMRHDFHWMLCFSAAECQSTWNDERQLCTNELQLPLPFSTQITCIAVQVYITLDPGIDQTQLHGNFTWCYNDEFDEVEDARDV